jgi:DNA-binding Lrp family transcriptional regulator
MKNITTKEMETVLRIVKSPEVMYNANSLANDLKMSAMGGLKIVKRLEKEGILVAKKIGQATVYRINTENEYARKFVALLLSREVLHEASLVRRWVNEIKKVKNSDIAMLFGSVLHKKDPNDIDVLFVTDKKRFSKLEEEIRELNQINIKQIHPMYQSEGDIITNIQKRDKPLLNAIKGIVVFGEEEFIQIYNESRKE